MTFMRWGVPVSRSSLRDSDSATKRVPPPATPKQPKVPKVSEVVQSGVKLDKAYRNVYRGEELAIILLRGRTWLPEGDKKSQVLSLPAAFREKYYVQDVSRFGNGYIVEVVRR